MMEPLLRILRVTDTTLVFSNTSLNSAAADILRPAPACPATVLVHDALMDGQIEYARGVSAPLPPSFHKTEPGMRFSETREAVPYSPRADDTLTGNEHIF